MNYPYYYRPQRTVFMPQGGVPYGPGSGICGMGQRDKPNVGGMLLGILGFLVIAKVLDALG